MPKAARYPLFLLGMAIIILGGLEARNLAASAPVTALVAVAGLVVIFLSVAIK
jgi:hypothetical protein